MIQYKVAADHNSDTYELDEDAYGFPLEITTEGTEGGIRYAKIKLELNGEPRVHGSPGSTSIDYMWSEGDTGDDYELAAWQ